MEDLNQQLVARNWRDLIRPKNIRLSEDSSTDFYGKFVVEPLERGFGLTLGNALRRVLLSSIQGTAITSVKIDGALHEFTSVPDVVEDVTDIILNLKEVVLRSKALESVPLRVKKEGPSVVTAADLAVDHRIEVMNPDHVICTVAKGGTFSAVFNVGVGRGYSPAEKNRTSSLAIGAIPIDSIYTPIRKVNYTVTNARVGQITDYDKLTLEVWTDASAKPIDAVAYASKILKEQLNVFINFEEFAEPVVEEATEEPLNENLFRSVDELQLSVRSTNCLQNANIRLIGELVQKSEADMLKTKNFGRKSLKEIKEILDDMGLSLGMRFDNWPQMLERWKTQQQTAH